MKEIIDGVIGTKNVAEWVEILDNMGIPCSPINTIENVSTTLK